MFQERSRRSTRTGLFRTHAEFPSKFLKSARTVLVHLPPGYEESPERRYPVLYLQDGQNLFDGATSFIPGQEWRVDETAERLIHEKKIEPLIQVGIYNSGVDRLDEYTPMSDARGRGGKGELYSRFLIEELKPFIDRTYRTLPKGKHTGLGGSSLGGLISLSVGLKHPEAFSRLAILSPSVWWADRAILKEITWKLPLRLWVDIGTAEGSSALPDARLLRDTLVAHGWREGEDLTYREFAGATHSESAWAERFDQVLLALFPA